MEKLSFTLVTAARKLKPYFQAYTIVVLMDKPLRRAMGSPEVTRRMELWVVELGEFNIQYRPCIAIKGQVVVKFIVEFTLMEGQRAEEIPSGAFTQTDPLISKKEVSVWCSTLWREIRSSA